MKKSVFLLTVFILSGIMLVPTYATQNTPTQHSLELVQSLQLLEEKYGIPLEISYGEKPGSIDINSIEELEKIMQDIKPTPHKRTLSEIEFTTTPTHQRANNIATYHWQYPGYTEGDPTNTYYFQNIEFTYGWKDTFSGAVFTEHKSIDSYASGGNNGLIVTGLEYWEQLEQHCTFTAGNKVAAVSVVGRFRLGVNFGDMHISLPMQKETWSFNLRIN